MSGRTIFGAVLGALIVWTIIVVFVYMVAIAGVP